LTATIFCSYTYYIFVFPLEVQDTFLRNIDIVTPYVEKHEVDMLKSDWARMKSKADYESIDARMMTIIDKNGLLD